MVDTGGTTMKTKTCTGPCGKTKPLDDFSPSRLGRLGRASKCKECKRLINKAYRDRNLDKERERGRRKAKVYYHVNAKQINERRRSDDDYKKKNAKRVREKRRSDPQRHRAQVHKYYITNRDTILKKKSSNRPYLRLKEKSDRARLADYYVLKLASGIDSIVPMVRAKIQLQRSTKQLLQTIKEKQDERN